MRNSCVVSVVTLEFAKQTESATRDKTEHELAVASLNWQNQSKKHILRDMKNVSLHSRRFKREKNIRTEKSLSLALFSFEGAKCAAIAGHIDCATAQYH